MNKGRKNYKHLGKTEIRLIAACIFLTAGTLLLLSAGRRGGWAEWYSTSIYPVIVSTIGRISGLVSFSLSELCLYGIFILFFGTLIHALIQIATRKQGGPIILQWSSGVFLCMAVLFFLYAANCGINYKRVSFSEKAKIEIIDYTAEDLAEVCVWLTEEVNQREGLAERDKMGKMILSGDVQLTGVEAMNSLGKTYPSLSGFYPRPKPVLMSEILSYQALSGVYSPFTVEANYNEDMVPYNIPFTACHELSHLRGFMQEEEANFIAFLACKEADSIDFQYSAYLMGWIYCMNELYRVDEQKWQEVRTLLDKSVEADLEANSLFWTSYDGKAAEISNKVNDTYLKVNGQTEGVGSYDRMVDLIVSYRMAELPQD